VIVEDIGRYWKILEDVGRWGWVALVLCPLDLSPTPGRRALEKRQHEQVGPK